MGIRIGLASFFILSIVLSGVMMFDLTGAAGQDGPKDAAGSRDSTESVWPMEGHDLRHTGQSAVDTSSNTGDLLWRFTPEGQNNFISSPPTVGPDGTIYFGSNDNYLFALKPDGTKEWTFKTGDLIRGSPSIDANGSVYFSSDEGYLYALNPNGTEKWDLLIRTTDRGMKYMSSSPMVLKNGTIYVGSDDYDLYAIDPNGNIKWTFGTAASIMSSPAIADDGSIYVGAGEYLYKLTPDGKLLWKFPVTFNWASAPAIGSSGIIYAPTVQSLYAIYPNGTFYWKYDLDLMGPSNIAISNDGTIYFGSAGALYAIDASGTLKWKYQEADQNWSIGPPTLGSEGTIYWVSRTGFFYAFHPDGTVKWAHRISGAFAEASGLTIGPDGNIYTGLELEGAKDDYVGLVAFGKNGTYSEVPRPPTGLQVLKFDNYIDLRWDPAQKDEGLPIIKYELLNGKSEAFGPLIGVVNGTNTTYRYVPRGEPYQYFAVIAVNSNGESPTSTWVSATPGVIEPPPPPKNLNATHGDGYVVLTWDAPTGPGSSNLRNYRIYRGNGTTDRDPLADTDPQVLSYNDTTVKDGTSYHYYVKAVYNDSESNLSIVRYVVIPIKDKPPLPEEPHPWRPNTVVVATALGICSIGVLLVALAVGTDIGRFKIFTALIPLHTKLKREKVLDHIERGRIIEYIIKNPGADYSEIGTNLDLNNGLLAYHLKVLERTEYVKSVTAGLHRRFYSFEFKIPDDAHKTIQEMMIDHVKEHPDATRKELAEAMGAPLSTINYHCDLLVRAKVLQSSKIGRRKRYRLQQEQ